MVWCVRNAKSPNVFRAANSKWNTWISRSKSVNLFKIGWEVNGELATWMTQNRHDNVICSRLEVAGEVISSLSMKTIGGNIVVTFEAASSCSFWDNKKSFYYGWRRQLMIGLSANDRVWLKRETIFMTHYSHYPQFYICWECYNFGGKTQTWAVNNNGHYLYVHNILEEVSLDILTVGQWEEIGKMRWSRESVHKTFKNGDERMSTRLQSITMSSLSL